MIIEKAEVTVTAGREDEFEQTLLEARTILATSPGFRFFQATRGVERPSTFLLLIGWETLDDHLVTFRDSDRFPRWRSYIGPFFADPPVVEHFAECGGRYVGE